jgi:hypothetical protein
VVIDTETGNYSGYLTAMDKAVTGAGYKLVNYGSLDDILKNPLTSGGRWTADWTGVQHIDDVAGVVATQWADAAQLGTSYDASLCDDDMPLWNTKPPTWEETAATEAVDLLARMTDLKDLLQSHAA